MKKSNFLIYILLLTFVVSFNLSAQDVDSNSVQPEDTVTAEEIKIGDIRAGDFSGSVHVIKLLDENGYEILKDDEVLMPFSTKKTCGECHSYNTVSQGLHFNDILNDDEESRKSEPFIFWDPYTLTVLPISYKNRSGTFNPKTIALSPMKFMDLFGSHYTGGIISETEDLQHPENYFRWAVSGKLEINCLICHDADPAYDAAEFSSQILKQNYRWASAAGSGFAEVKGSAENMPVNFDPFNSNTYADVDLRTSPPPTVIYDFSKFNGENKVFFDIERIVPEEKCYYCHSSVISTDEGELFLHNKEDVHLKSGMTCVDCHRNNLNHEMIRGYENEWEEKGNPSIAAFSCKGCHLGSGNSEFPLEGNFGAPRPAHTGIPSIHFDKMSCTVCHAGSWPQGKTNLVKTSRAHKLGAHFASKTPNAYPHIQSSVFVKNENDKIELSNSMWSSYWAVKRGNIIQPLDINFLESRLRPLLDFDSLLTAGIVPRLSDSLLTIILSDLNRPENKEIEIIYISGDKQAGLDEEGKLKITTDQNAEAYTWPIAHTVRPASQSLGIRGCNDCHTFNSSFFFPAVESETFVESAPAVTFSMSKSMGINVIYNKLFSLSFIFKPLLKFVIIISCAVILFTVLIFLGRSLHAVSRYASAASSGDNDGRQHDL